MQDSLGRLYANSDHVFRSDDNGRSWEAMAASCLKLSFIDHNDYLYCGLSRSTDYGQTWDQPFVAPYGDHPIDVRAIAFNRKGDLFVGNRGEPAWQRAALYRFLPDQISVPIWMGVIPAQDIGGNSTVKQLLVKPESGAMFAVMNVHGMYRSLDDGDSWKWVTGEPESLRITALTLSPEGNLLAGSANGILLKSIDDGNTWMTLNPIFQDSAITSIIAVSESELFLSIFGAGVFFSKDAGYSWQARSVGFDDWDLSINVLHRDSGRNILYAGTTVSGIYRSTDNGESWHMSNKGMHILGEQHLSVTSKNHIFVGTEGKGLFRSIDSGKSFQSINRGLPVAQYPKTTFNSVWRNTFYTVHEGARGSLFLRSEIYEPNWYGNVRWDLFKSTNEGQLWERIRLPRPEWRPSDLAFTPDGAMLLASAYDGPGVYITNDEGLTWDTLGLTDQSVTSLLSLSSSEFLAGTDYYEGDLMWGVYRTLDSGHTWTRTGGWSFNGNFLARDVFGSVYSANPWYGVMKSTDKGLTWSIINDGLTSTHIWPITIDQDGTAYVGLPFNPYRYGVFRLTQGAIRWEAINNGLLSLDIWALATDSLGYLYAASWGEGLFRTSEPTISATKENDSGQPPTSFSLSQNYPNPFNPTTKFEVRIAKYEFVSLRVYNLLGEEVATLLKEEKPPGTYTIEWDVIGLPSGVYFYTMTAGGFRETRKLLLVR